MGPIWTRHMGHNTTVPETLEMVSEGRSLGAWVLRCGPSSSPPCSAFERNPQATKGLETHRQERGGGEARRERQKNPGALGEAGRLGLARSHQCLAK